ncbi:MAG TPA: BolA/IbaG family iron-sulfur metabolism protein [Oleiagrimonas sp.]|nr:BolA/IbaG family iron-sulfur metabolism protein [Oleiagrimonas sp.]
MDTQTIKSLIEKALPDAVVEVHGDDGVHFEANVTSDAFAGKTRLARHRIINAALGDRMGGAIHALSLPKLKTHEEAAARGSQG